jgi:NADH-quinone oxidoreductase subunit C
MAARIQQLKTAVETALSGKIVSLTEALGELVLEVKSQDYPAVAKALHDTPSLGFEQLIDLCGVDYSQYGDGCWNRSRFAVVVQLLSVAQNWRLRLRVFASEDEFPVLESVTGIWVSAGWYEREAFDLYGIMFSGHTDLRRILTDYGFIGHPFRKDFPISGNVEMRYDPEQKRVIYEPVSIEPREVTPRIIREEAFGEMPPRK